MLLGVILGRWLAPRFHAIARVERDQVTLAEARATAAWLSTKRTEFGVVVTWPLVTGTATLAYTHEPLLAMAAAAAGILTVPGILCLQAGVSRRGARAATAAMRRVAMRHRRRRMLVLTEVLLAALCAENPEPWAPTPSHRRPHITAVAQHPVAQAPARTPIAAQAPPAAVVPDLAPPGVVAV